MSFATATCRVTFPLVTFITAEHWSNATAVRRLRGSVQALSRPMARSPRVAADLSEIATAWPTGPPLRWALSHDGVQPRHNGGER